MTTSWRVVRQRGPEFKIAELDERVGEILRTGRLTEGPFRDELESKLSARAGRPVKLVSSGAAALDIAMEIVRYLRGASGKRIRVGVPMVGHWTDRAAVERINAEIVWLPVSLERAELALQSFVYERDEGAGPRHVDRSTKVIGIGDLDALLWVPIGGWFHPGIARYFQWEAQRAGAILIVDASHAIGDPRALMYGDMAISSLFATKLLTTGEGGAFAASDPDLLAIANSLRDGGRAIGMGRDTEAWAYAGTDRRLPELSAALGLASLATLDDRMARRAAIMERYRVVLSTLAGQAEVPTVVDTRWGRYKFLVRPIEVERFEALLLERGAATASRVFERPLFAMDVGPGGVHEDPFAFGRVPAEDDPTARAAAWGWCAGHVALPLHEAMTDAEVDQVCVALEYAIGYRAP